MKKKDILLSIPYSIPWAAVLWWLAPNFGDVWTAASIVLAMAVTGLLAYLCGREKNMTPVYMGNILAAVLNTVLLHVVVHSGIQLELFWPSQWALFFLALTAPVQAAAWHRRWGWLVAYFALLAAIVGGLYSLQFTM